MCYLRMFLQKNAMHVAVPQEKGRSAVHSEKAKKHVAVPCVLQIVALSRFRTPFTTC